MNIEVGNIVEGKVVKIKPFGAIVLIDNSVQGLVHISHIANSYVQDINDHVAVGDMVNVKVLSIDSENGKVALSMKEANPTAKKPEYQRDDRPRNQSFDNQRKEPLDATASFEEKFKEWVKASNERQAGLNKRNKRR